MCLNVARSGSRAEPKAEPHLEIRLFPTILLLCLLEAVSLAVRLMIISVFSLPCY